MLAAGEIGDSALVAEGHLRVAALLMSHDFAASEDELRRCLEIAADLGSHRIEAEATSWLGAVAYYRGRPDEGDRLSLQARTWFERTGDSYFQVQNLISNLAIFALEDGRAEDAEAWLREALPLSLQIGGWVLLKTYWHLVEALVAQDRLDDARELVVFAARSVPEEDPQCPAWLCSERRSLPPPRASPPLPAAAFAEAAAPVRGARLRARRCRGPTCAGAVRFVPSATSTGRESRIRACPHDVRRCWAPTCAATRSTRACGAG